MGLFVADQVLSPVDILFYGALPPGELYARDADEAAGWRTRAR